jgi:hypothetical protein
VACASAPSVSARRGSSTPAHRERHRALAARAAVVEVHLALEAVVHAAERRARADRPGDRRHLDAEHPLGLLEQVERIERRPVELVDEGEDRDAAPVADLEQLDGLRLHAARRVEQHDRRVGGRERAVRVLAEVLVAGRVEQVEHVSLERHLQRRRRDADAALALERHEVAGRALPPRLAAHDARLAQRSGVEQQLLRQRRLPGVGVRHDREGAAAGGLVRRVVSMGVAPPLAGGPGGVDGAGEHSRRVTGRCSHRPTLAARVRSPA